MFLVKEMAMQKELFEILLQVFPSFVMIIIGYFANLALKKFEANQYLTDCIKAVEKAVNLTAQKYTGSLKSSKENLTKNQQEIALEMAKDFFLDEMGEGTKAIIESIYGDFDKWFSSEVDSYLGKGKK